ncbi:MAG: glycoside hydrolase family 5 protein, partial [Actinobacteria bacterium]|nr:glycoside hydrolase family 5 protein [Actinomycetota bacterium]
QAAGMAQLLAVVRAAAPSSVAIADGPQYAGEPPTNALSDPAVVYGAHAYTCPSAVGGQDCKANPYSAGSALAGWDAFARSHPVAVTEFGWPAPGDGRYDASVISYAEGRGWGWIAFAWDGTTVGRFDLLADTVADEPSVTGQAVLRGLSVTRRAAGQA